MDELTTTTLPLEGKLIRARSLGAWQPEELTFWHLHDPQPSRHASHSRNAGRFRASERLLALGRSLVGKPVLRVPVWQMHTAGILTLFLLVGVGRMLRDSYGAAPAPGDAPQFTSQTAAPSPRGAEERPAAIQPPVPAEPHQGVGPNSAPEVVASGISGATIQVATFRDRSNAERLVEDLRDQHHQVQVRQLENDLYLVTMGPFLSRQTADGIAKEIQSEMQLSTLVVSSPLVHVRVAAP